METCSPVVHSYIIVQTNVKKANVKNGSFNKKNFYRVNILHARYNWAVSVTFLIIFFNGQLLSYLANSIATIERSMPNTDVFVGRCQMKSIAN